MCGLPRPVAPQPVVDQPANVDEPTVEPSIAPVALAPPPAEEVFPVEIASTVRESRSSILFWVVAAVVVGLLGFTWLALRNQAPAVMAAFIPTMTPLPPTETPAPTSTPRDPRAHTVAAGAHTS